MTRASLRYARHTSPLVKMLLAPYKSALQAAASSFSGGEVPNCFPTASQLIPNLICYNPKDRSTQVKTVCHNERHCWSLREEGHPSESKEL